ncbi:MAG: hypothetical protein QM713_14460 [Arachnia sp.]
MVTDFFATTVDDWTDPSGQLHAYLVPCADVHLRLTPALDTLRGLGFLAPQPIEALHATVQRFPFLVGDLDDAALARLRAAGERAGVGLAPVRFAFGAPGPAGDAVIVRAESGEPWERITGAVRQIAEEALGPEALHYGLPFGPHMTLAYATATGDDATVTAALAADERATVPLGEVEFTEIAWCAVHQNRAVGTYTFDTLFVTPLGA